MRCNDLGPIEPYGISKNAWHTIKNAGVNVGLDLEKPIDCSQMDLYEVSSFITNNNYKDKMEVNRRTVLHAFVFNEDGDREELTITFELKSQKIPKLVKD